MIYWFDELGKEHNDMVGKKCANLPGHLQRMPCISDEEIIEIARVAKAAEKSLGGPQDMEWAVDQDLSFPGSLFWLQTRPAKVAAKKKVSASSHIAEMIAKKFGGV